MERVNGLEPEMQALGGESLKAKTDEFRDRIEKGANLDELLAEAFAVVREASVRTTGLRHFDVQIIGGLILHEGNIAEMKTGEGKTLVATLPIYLNALTGKGAHVVTVNDYLARRDAEWMGAIYGYLGLTTGCVVPGLDDTARRAAYAADVTYGTNNEFGFDYLRDNMKPTIGSMVQRKHAYAIVDEVDSILIDEARTPLIISGPTQDRTDLYRTVDLLVPRLDESHYEIDEKARSAHLTEEGNDFVEELLREQGLLEGDSLFDAENATIVHHVNQALRAHKLYRRERDYIVRDGQVVIIDEFTGRMMSGRRYGAGLHQAVEAKERVEIQAENVTFASITFQNYFRLYGKLAGMTGTAMTEAEEFQQIYGLETVEIPTNMPMIRADDDDQVFRTLDEKNAAIVDAIREAREREQPVLVGTTSIDKSEALSSSLKALRIPHNVLNARYHEQEAAIIAEAGAPGAVTIATNMAGRGTDIQLGGNLLRRISDETAGIEDEDRVDAIRDRIADELEDARERVIAAGGLWIVGTERHESRRIDNQLRGRSGRQGDPGRSTFFLSLEDDLLRIFGSERMDGMLRKLGLEDGEAIVHPWVNKAVEKAQGKVEARNFEIRKNLLKYDDVVNDQRKIVFEQRREIMESADLSAFLNDLRADVIEGFFEDRAPEGAYAERWDLEALEKDVTRVFGIRFPFDAWQEEAGSSRERLLELLDDATESVLQKWALAFGPVFLNDVQRAVMLNGIDVLWREHLETLDHLRSVIGFRGFAQRNPLNEYKLESFGLFEDMLTRYRIKVIRDFMHVRVVPQAPTSGTQPAEAGDEVPERVAARTQPRSAAEVGPSPGQRRIAAMAAAGAPVPAMAARGDAAALAPEPGRVRRKVGRNEPCPCGSGRKYKRCCGA